MGYNPKDSKCRPPEVKERDSKQNGDFQHDFNIKGKITKLSGADYEDVSRSNSGLYGNFSEKDANMEYLRERNKQGQEVRNYNATKEQARLYTFGGTTAYDSRPIPETYKPATSQGEVPANAVVYKTTMKDRNDALPYTEDTESNKATRDITEHIKGKE